VMRDTPDAVRMAEKLVASIDVPEPEVIIEVEVLEIARSRVLDLGISYPGSVTATPSPVSGATGLVLSDLKHQNSNTIQISSLSATLSAMQQHGDTNTLASPRIRARNKEKAKILIGSRVPVITNSVTPTASSAVVTGSVQYLDVGLTLEIQPTIYLDGDVAIKVGLEVSNITNQITTSSGTVAYTIGTRNANTTLRLKDGETQILAGLIQDSDTRSASGIPGLSQIPVVGRLFGSNHGDREKNEVVLSITPRIIRTQARPPADATEFWFGTETRSRSTPFTSSAFEAGASGAAAGGSGGGGSGSAEVGPRVSGTQPVIPMPPVVPPVVQAAQAQTQQAPVTGQPPPAAVAAAQAAASAGPPPHPTVTIDGPVETSVGQEFDVTVRLATDTGIGRLRGQVRFDSTAMQLVSATAGDLVPSSAGSPNVDAKSGGAQLDVVSTDDPISGEGSLMLLRFKALTAHPASSIVAQVSAVGAGGTALASAASQPLSLAIKP
jgi:general secretion pathway protein D